LALHLHRRSVTITIESIIYYLLSVMVMVLCVGYCVGVSDMMCVTDAYCCCGSVWRVACGTLCACSDRPTDRGATRQSQPAHHNQLTAHCLRFLLELELETHYHYHSHSESNIIRVLCTVH
jgi:hypothetical protein